MKPIVARTLPGPLRETGPSASLELIPNTDRILLQLSGSVSSAAPPGWVGVRPELDGQVLPDPDRASLPAAARIFDLMNPSRQAVVPLSLEVDVEAGRSHLLTLRPMNPNSRTDERDLFTVTVFDVGAAADADAVDADGVDADETQPKTAPRKRASRKRAPRKSSKTPTSKAESNDDRSESA